MRKIISFLAVSLFAVSASANVTLTDSGWLNYEDVYSSQADQTSTFSSPITTLMTTTWTSTFTYTSTSSSSTYTTRQTFTSQFPITISTTTWTEIDFVTPYEASGAVRQAAYSTSTTASTVGGGTADVILRPAFNGYNALMVNGDLYYGNGSGSLDCSGQQVNLGTQVVDGAAAGALDVWRKVHVSADGVARWVTFIENTSGSEEEITAMIMSRLGAVERTKILASSSDAYSPLTTDDGWFVTGGDFLDPRVAHVIAGSAGLAPSAISVADGSEIASWSYNFFLEAGATIALVNFVSMSGIVDDSVTFAEDLYADWDLQLECLTTEEIALIANFEETSPEDCSTLNTDCETFAYDVGTDSCKSTAIDCSGVEDSCNGSACTEGVGCVAVALADGGDCDDGDACTQTTTCTTGICGGGTAVTCTGLADQCNTDSCDSVLGCVASPVSNGTSCDDANLCTDSDVCTAGSCSGAAKDCSSLNATCYSGQCNASTGSCEAVVSPAGTSCDDAEWCTEGDACDSAGACVGEWTCDEESEPASCNCTTSGAAAWWLVLGAIGFIRRRRLLG
ncbi:hypothetical protein KAI87_09385 [Myxococcota bacterium]|nr:hypothetical protein [Myxococcota bacterium]